MSMSNDRWAYEKAERERMREEAEEAKGLNTTVPGGRYQRFDGTLVNANGEEIGSKAATRTGDAAEALADAADAADDVPGLSAAPFDPADALADDARKGKAAAKKSGRGR